MKKLQTSNMRTKQSLKVQRETILLLTRADLRQAVAAANSGDPTTCSSGFPICTED